MCEYKIFDFCTLICISMLDDTIIKIKIKHLKKFYYLDKNKQFTTVIYLDTRYHFYNTIQFYKISKIFIILVAIQ